MKGEKELNMKPQSYGFKLLAAILAAFTVDRDGYAGKPLVPFKGQSTGVITTVGFDPELGVVSTRAEGQGEATHLGHFTVTNEVSIYVFTPTGVAIGNWTYVTANGDKLFVHMVGSGGPDPLHGVGTFTITGGTGRFKGRAEATSRSLRLPRIPLRRPWLRTPMYSTTEPSLIPLKNRCPGEDR